MSNILVSLIQGIVLGGCYGCIALGLSLIFGVTRVTNFAHGSILMMSAFAYYGLWQLFRISPFVGMILVVPLFFIFGYIFQKVFIKPLLERERAHIVEPISCMLMTIGIWYMLDNLFTMIFGSDFRKLETPFSKSYLNWLNNKIVIQTSRALMLAMAVVLMIVLYIILNRTELGLKIRAVSQNRDAAALCGVDVYKTYSMTFGLGFAAVTLAGACLTQFYFVQPQIGTIFGTKSFMIVIFGGLGSIPGALLGGLFFGIVESVGAQFMNSSSATILSFLMFIIFLIVRPKGLLGKS